MIHISLFNLIDWFIGLEHKKEEQRRWNSSMRDSIHSYDAYLEYGPREMLWFPILIKLRFKAWKVYDPFSALSYGTTAKCKRTSRVSEFCNLETRALRRLLSISSLLRPLWKCIQKHSYDHPSTGIGCPAMELSHLFW